MRKVTKLGHQYEVRELPQSMREEIKRNMEYWDTIDAETEAFIKAFYQFGGIELQEIGDYSMVREVQEAIMTILHEHIKEFDIPSVDGNY